MSKSLKDKCKELKADLVWEGTDEEMKKELKTLAERSSTKPKVLANKDIVEDFWKKYINADSFERREMLKKIVPAFIEGLSMENKKMREQDITNLLQSYFDDLICVMNKRGGKN